MAAPTYFGSASNPADNGSQNEPVTLAVTPPGSMVSGDLVILIGQIQVATSGLISLSATGGQSWTSADAIFTANDQSVSLWWCQYNGTWSADPSLAFAAASGTQTTTAAMLVFRPDAVGTWQVDVAYAPNSEASQDPMVVTDTTPTKRDSVSIAGIAIGSSAATVASVSGSGWTLATFGGANQLRNLAGGDQSAAYAYRLQSAPSATANASFDLNTASSGMSFTMVWNNALVPTISPNTADATNFGSDNTPTLEFTGTDGNADDLRYQMQIDTANTFDSLTGSPVIVDSYSEANSDATSTPVNSAQNTHVGQSFDANTGGKLLQVKFYLTKTGSPTGNATAKIYAHTGTYGGSDGTTTGAVLATSDNLDVSTLTGSAALYTLTFSGAERIALSASTKYVCMFAYSGGDISNRVNLFGDQSSPTHGGSLQVDLNATAPSSPINTTDAIFYVYVAGTVLDKLSGTDSGFANTVTGGDTDPFNSGEKASFTVQAGDALADGTYYWRARAKDPSGSNTYSSWTTARSFTVTNVAFMPDFNRPIMQAIKRASLY